MTNTVEIGNVVEVVKGCRARDIAAGQKAYVKGIEFMGAEYGHSVKVILSFPHKTIVFYARHRNRLSDAFVNLNDGNPLHKIIIRKI